MLRQLDITTRMTLLEGHLELPKGTLSGNPRRGLREARALFAEQPIHPEWLSNEDTGVYGFLRARLIRELHGDEAHADDILQRSLMGLGVDNQNIVKGAFRSAGESRQFGEALEAGKPPHTCVNASGLSSYLFRRGLGENNREANRQAALDQYGDFLYEVEAPEPSAADILAHLVVHGDNELADQLRGLMFNSWRGTVGERTMKTVWKALVKGENLNRGDLAAKLGMTRQGVYQQWSRGWALFAEALHNHPGLHQKLEAHLLTEGVTAPWGPSEVLSTIAHTATRNWMTRRMRTPIC
jgi:hypothetical protein